jgi:HlyD family secretion protein
MNDLLKKLKLPPVAVLAKRRSTWIVAAVMVTFAIVGFARLGPSESMQHIGAKVLQGEIRDEVEATGTVNAVITVQVGSQVSGAIAKLNADFNSHVKKGDVVALIAPQLFQGAVLQASADVADAKANVTVAEANLSKAKAALVQNKSDYDRTIALAEQKIASQQALDQALAIYVAAKATVEAGSANILQAKAQVNQKEAALEVARTNLNYTIIRSPIDGIVVARNVDVGQTVAASLQAPTIFTIAQDLTKMQVYTKVDESDVGRIVMGHQVTFKVDAYPKEVYQGRVSQIRMNPTRVQNVVTYDAIIDFDNPSMKLFPGMTAYVTIPVATVASVVKIPNAALRYRPSMPPETVRALYKKFGLEEGDDPKVAGKGKEPEPQKKVRPEAFVVWKLKGDGSIEPVKIALGITDHTYTEVTKVLVGSLGPADEVVTTTTQSKTPIPGAQGARR